MGEFLYELYVKPKREAEVLKGTLFDEYILFCLDNNLVNLKRPAFYKKVKKREFKNEEQTSNGFLLLNWKKTN